MGSSFPRFLVVAAMLGIIALIASCSGMQSINQGYMGVKVSLGSNMKSTAESLTPGMYFYNPFTTSIYEIDVRTQTVGADDVPTFTKDTQGVTVNYKASLRINPQHVALVYSSLGTDLESGNLGRLIQTQTLNSLKAVIAGYGMDEMLANRPKLPEQVTAHLRNSLTSVLVSMNLPQDAIMVDGFSIENIAVDPAYEEAAEAKQRATQEAERAKNETVKKEEEAKQMVIAAQAEADSKIAVAKAEAEGFKIKNDALAASPRLIEYTLAQNWDGALPIMVSSDKANQIMDIRSLSGILENRKASRVDPTAVAQ